MANRASSEDLRGLHVPIVTPMSPDGEIDDRGLHALAKHMAADEGVTGIVTTARIGEGLVLTRQEQVTVAQEVRRVVDDAVPITATIDPRTAEEAIDRIAELAEVGANAIMIFPPLSLAWGEVPSEVRVEFHRTIAEASELPLVLFQIPVRSYRYEVEEVVRIAELDNVLAMKDASFSLDHYRETVRALQRHGAQMEMLNGNDRFVAEGSLVGASGSLIGIANLFPTLWDRVHQLATAGDVEGATSLQEQLYPLQRLIFDEPILDAVARLKVALVEDGILECDHVRKPQLGLGADARDAFRRGYAQLKEQLASVTGA